jgi:carbon-monoxide dehydrogenase large subunit
LEAAEGDIEFDDGIFAVAGTDRRLTLAEVAQAAHSVLAIPPGMEPGLQERAVFAPPAPTFPNGCHVCEVEIDPESGALELLDYTVADDVGTVINPMMVKGQIHGGIAQGLGQVLFEQVLYDEHGQLLTASFMDYAMPRASDMSRTLTVATNTVPSTTNPLGIKGAGEAGTVGALPAIMSAVLDALAPVGVTHIEMPVTPECIWRAITSAPAPNQD